MTLALYVAAYLVIGLVLGGSFAYLAGRKGQGQETLMLAVIVALSWPLTVPLFNVVGAIAWFVNWCYKKGKNS